MKQHKLSENCNTACPNRQAQSRVLVIIPAYNAQTTLSELVHRIRLATPDVDMLIVDDGSSDQTSTIMAQLAVTQIALRRNSGKGSALRAGFSFAVDHGYRSVVTIDADLQHPPEDIPRLLARDDGNTFVLGARRLHPAVMPLPRWMSNSLTSLVHSIAAGEFIRDAQCGFRLVPARILRQVHLTARRFDIESELLFAAVKQGFKIEHVSIATLYTGAPSAIRGLREIGGFLRQLGRFLWSR